MKKVSIIIPTFNRANYISHALESVLNQTYKDFEVIVVDDGSNDNTREVLGRYKDIIKYIYQNNSGVSAARNAGIRQAEGEWVAFLDSDDEWMPDYLSLQMRRVEQNPEVCTHITNSIQVRADGTRINSFQVKKSNLYEFLMKEQCNLVRRPMVFVLKHHITNLQATIMKRDALIKAGLFNEKLTIAEDLDAITRMCLHGPLGICGRPLVYIMRRNETIGNLTSQLFSMHSYECFGEVYENLRNQDKLTKAEKAVLNEMYSANRRAIANLFLERGETIKARSYFKESLTIYPSVKSVVKFLIAYLPRKVALSLCLKRQTINSQ